MSTGPPQITIGMETSLKNICQLLSPLVFKWGMVVCTLLIRSIFHYGVESMDHDYFWNSSCTSFSVHAVSRKTEGDATIMGIIK